MIEEVLPEKDNELEFKQKNTAILIDVGDALPITIELPPFDEIVRIKELKYSLSSPEDLIPAYTQFLQKFFSQEYKRKVKKLKKFDASATFHNRLGTVSELSGDIELALAHITKASELSDDLFLKQRRGVYLVKSNKVSEAFEVFGSDEVKGDSSSLMYLTLLMIREDRIEEARVQIDKALAIDPLHAQARVVSGILYLINSQFKASIAELRVASEDRPRDYTIFHNMALGYLYLNQEDRARESAKRAYFLNPLNKDSAILYSDLLIRKLDFETAKNILRHYLAFDSKTKAVHERLALAYYKSGEFSACIDALKVEASIEDTSSVWNNIAVAYAKKGEKDKALQYYAFALKRMIEENSDNPTLINNFVRALTSAGKSGDAIKISGGFLKTKSLMEIAAKPGLASILVSHTMAKFESDPGSVDIEMIDNILENFQVVLTSKIDLLVFASYYYTLVDQREARALSYANQLLELYFNSSSLTVDTKATVINNVIFTYLEFDHFEMAEEIIKELLPFVHERAIPTATYGLFLMKKNVLDRGEKFYREAVGLTKSSDLKEKIRAKLYIELAKSYISLGNESKAKECFDRSRKHDAKGVFNLSLPKLLNKKKT